MGPFRGFATAVAIAALAAPVAAQLTDSFTFLQAVRERDGDKALPLINKGGPQLVNTRDGTTGDTALHIVTRGHDQTWLGFLLGRGARTDLKNRDGDTPLAIAARTGDTAAGQLLLSVGAPVDSVNGSGETPLILAVHTRNAAMIRLLVANGADPKIRDTIAGKSAHDYASDDPRGQPLVKLLDAAAPRASAPARISGPKL